MVTVDRDRHPPPGTTGPRFVAEQARWRAPVRHHRSTDARWASRLATAALLVVVLVVGGAVIGVRSTPDHAHRPYVVEGLAGEPVSTGQLEVTLRSVRTAAEIAGESGWRHSTSGVWILALVRVEALREPLSVGHAALRAPDGRSWSASGRFRQPLTSAGHRLQPGVPVEAELVFEVPQEVATRLVLEVAANWSDLRMAAVAQVPLPIDEALVAQGLDLTEPVKVAQVEIVAGTPVRLEPVETDQ